MKIVLFSFFFCIQFVTSIGLIWFYDSALIGRAMQYDEGKLASTHQLLYQC